MGISDREFVEFLDQISIAFIQPSFAIWSGSVLLPFSLVTKDGPVILRTQEELEDNFNHYLQAIDAMEIDRIYRTPVSLERCHDDTWIGTYRTNLLSRNNHATDPYTSSALLLKSASGLQMLSILNARGHHDWVGEHPSRALYGSTEKT